MATLHNQIEQLSSLPLSEDVLKELMDARLSMNFEVNKEEIYWEQRARTNWLKNDDRNTSFFHQFASARKCQNRIDRIEDSTRGFVEGDLEVRRVAKDYFEKLFSSKGVSNEEGVFKGGNCCISVSMNASLNKTFMKVEITSALKSRAPLKDSRADDLRAIFYQCF